MTLTELRTMTKQLLAQRTVTTEDDTTWYTNRVNNAYRRITSFQGQVMFPAARQPQFRILRFFELEDSGTQTIASGLSTNFITPTVSNPYMVLDVYDETNNRWLQRVSIKRMRRLDPAETGTPLRWTPGGDGGMGYFVHPIPASSAQEITVREYTYTTPNALDGVTYVSPVIPESWHPAIAYAAAAEGAMLLDWAERHTEMEQRFMTFVAERKSPYEEADFAGGRRWFSIGGHHTS